VFLLVAAVIVAAAVCWVGLQIVTQLKAARAEAARGRVLAIFTAFAPAAGAAAEDPRAVLVWEPLARTARKLFSNELGEIERAAGGPFPFGAERIQAAHAQWTADWLAWEGAHDTEYKLKAAAIEGELAGANPPSHVRARLDAVEREKLDRYQRRYQ
jgi:hypothetical protein